MESLDLSMVVPTQLHIVRNVAFFF
jgi:hypothetical protein